MREENVAKGGEMTTILSIGFVVILLGGGLAFAFWHTCSSMDQGETAPADEPAVEATDLDYYVTGLPGGEKGSAGVKCSVAGHDLVFTGLFGKELGRISRNSINEVFVENRSTIHKRITATRLLAFGVFALALPKTTAEAEYCLVIDWNDQGGPRQNALFLFEGPGSMARAHFAANFLRRQVMAGGSAGVMCEQAV